MAACASTNYLKFVEHSTFTDGSEETNVATMKPTEAAQQSFGSGEESAYRAHLKYSELPSLSAKADSRQLGDMALANAVHSLARGLRNLSVGLRATYQLLEEVKRLIER